MLGTPAGKIIRADYTLLDASAQVASRGATRWRSPPSSGILSDSVTELELEAASDGTVVRLTTRLRMRGLSRFGGFQVTRATRRQLDGALDGAAGLGIRLGYADNCAGGGGERTRTPSRSQSRRPRCCAANWG